VSSDLLVVCTGNVCRSPYIAARLSAALAGLTVVSAGTGALVDEPPTAQILKLLEQRRVPLPGTLARSLTKPDVRGAGLVLTAERRHRVTVLGLSDDAGDRTFTLLELARLLREAGSPQGLGVDGAATLAQNVLRRGEDRDHDDDLADPFGRSGEAYRLMADRADEALEVVIRALREPQVR
jgi:protein-tyrosine phosphatase